MLLFDNILLFEPGHLLGRLAERQLQYQLVCNPIPKSVVWRMKRPSADCPVDAESQLLESEEPDEEDEPMSSQVKSTYFSMFCIRWDRGLELLPMLWNDSC